MYGMSVLVYCQAAELIKMRPHVDAYRPYTRVIDMEVMNMFSTSFFYVPIANFDKIDVNQPKCQNVNESALALRS